MNEFERDCVIRGILAAFGVAIILAALGVGVLVGFVL